MRPDSTLVLLALYKLGSDEELLSYRFDDIRRYAFDSRAVTSVATAHLGIPATKKHRREVELTLHNLIRQGLVFETAGLYCLSRECWLRITQALTALDSAAERSSSESVLMRLIFPPIDPFRLERWMFQRATSIVLVDDAENPFIFFRDGEFLEPPH
jgi:hypothetical protein